MSTRKQQILQEAVEIVASLGYGALSMRAVARASGIKLGALQYHFRTREDLLRALTAYIAETYRTSFEALHQRPDVASLREVVGFVSEDAAGKGLHADRLFPQLWAMALVEPIMEELMDSLYEEYLTLFEELVSERGAESPRAEALALMGLLEGLTLFVGRGRRWSDDAPAVGEAVYALIDARYGEA
ncbi:MAG: TetR/AcrR family transcriptional regulator [Proteobacteria bacterium]|nr:TetR/AcrR family transcriptional regulator [Pseudomonadota bacterium]MCP4919019.1 TetR/AcrR family transcriptional regulator [Pseudomonadota bacterium]